MARAQSGRNRLMRRAQVSVMGIIAGGLPLMLAAAQAATPTPPVTPEHDTVETYQGTTVHDPYQWLEQADAPAVQQWIDAQNAYTDSVMSGFSDHGAIVKRVGQLAVTSTQRFSPKIVVGKLFYLRQTPPQPQAVLAVEAWPKGEAKVLVDTNATKGDTAITNYWPSPDGTLVAYGVAEGGTENTTIR